MKIIALLVARNEAWILPASLKALMQWVDGAYIVVHASDDRTQAIVDAAVWEYDGRIKTTTVISPEWDEATYRGMVLTGGRAMGGTHFAVVDADELLTTAAAAEIRGLAADMLPGSLLRLPWLCCWRSLHQYRVDESKFGRAYVPILFADSPELTYAPDADGYQLHKRVPVCNGTRDIWTYGDGRGVLHLQHAKWSRVDAKQRRYMADELRRWGSVRADYAGTLDETGLVTATIPHEWWPVDPGLVDLEAEAWQAKA